jgi:predicted porin
MQKKLLAVAVAGALLAPVAAMAQSSVTISGVFKVGIDNIKISDMNAVRGDVNSSQVRLTDNSSRIIFGITEDLGGGLSGIAQLDVRPQLDDAGESNVAAGNTWVGIRSASLGTLTFGRHDLHYGKQPDDTSALAGALMASAVSLMDHTYLGGAIANATRTPNVIRYDTPNWGGFAATLAYTTNAFGNESDMSTNERKGNGWNVNPSFTSGPFQVGLSVWNAKSDAAAAGTFVDQKSTVLYGYYRLGGFKVGLAMNDAEVEASVGGVDGKIVDRRNFTIPVSWTMGQHHIAGHYTRAGEDKAADDLGIEETKARMIAVAYSYLLSKRTSVGVTYAKISNDENAAYNFFTNTSTGGNQGLGTVDSMPLAGEDPRLLAFTIRHAF